MDQDTAAHDTDDTSVASDTTETDELLIEEISIDGMCGVY
jgi:mycofactocin precursor